MPNNRLTGKAAKFAKFLRDNRACEEGYKAVRGMTLEEFWAACNRPEWMRWLAVNIDDDLCLLKAWVTSTYWVRLVAVYDRQGNAIANSIYRKVKILEHPRAKELGLV